MDAHTADRPNYLLGPLLNEGKTKKIYLTKGSTDRVTVVAKDDITAGDGVKHDIIPDKRRLATATTSNVFRLLKGCGLPVAFNEQDSAISFSAPKCEMLPYQVVARREAHGSYLKRNPHLAKGHLFPGLIVEFFLKTKDKNWKGKPLVCDEIPAIPRQASVRPSSGHSTSTPRPRGHASHQSHVRVGGTCRAWARESEWKIFRTGRGHYAWRDRWSTRRNGIFLRVGHAPQRLHCLAGHVRFEPANPPARYLIGVA